MSKKEWLPSEVREEVLAQHREIEAILSELELGVSSEQPDNITSENVKRVAYALRGILEMHMNFEESYMLPAIKEADGFGPERVRQLCEDHVQQRKQLDAIVRSIRAAESKTELVRQVKRLSKMLRKDIQEEEQDYVREDLLRDDLITVDSFGG